MVLTARLFPVTVSTNGPLVLSRQKVDKSPGEIRPDCVRAFPVWRSGTSPFTPDEYLFVRFGSVGQGSLFRVHLPAVPRPPVVSEQMQRPPELKGGSETILLVEDEVFVRQTAGSCLRKLGYTVLDAGNAGEALEVWAAHHEMIQILLTDMVMPGEMTGLELSQRLKAQKASLKIIVSSGYSHDLTKAGPLARQDTTYLAKPYHVSELAKAVRRSLDQMPGQTDAQD